MNQKTSGGAFITIIAEKTIEYQGMRAIVRDSKSFKILYSKNYNFLFLKENGFHMRWGKDIDTNPIFSPFGPEIADIEISINGCPNNCKFCYKENTNEIPTNMTLETFRYILNTLPPTLTQIAFGITGVKTNPDFVDILKLTKRSGIIPNFTLTGIDLDENTVPKLASLVGAVAISVYEQDKHLGYHTVNLFTKAGLQQTNIHLMVSEETIDFVYEVLNDYLYTDHIKSLNAFVFLGVKQKGRAKDHFHPLSTPRFNELIDFCSNKNIPYGFDSCSAAKYIDWVNCRIHNEKLKRSLITKAESCESSLFSTYINVKGETWNCSFCENEPDVEKVNLLGVKDYLKEVWYSKQVVNFRDKVLKTTNTEGTRKCFLYDI